MTQLFSMKKKDSSPTETESTSHNTEERLNANQIDKSQPDSEREVKRQLYELEMQLKNLEIKNKELHKSEARYKTMIAAIGDVICIIGTDSFIKYTSPNVEKYFGWQPVELVGTMDIWNLVYSEDLDGLQTEFNTLLLNASESCTSEVRLKCKSGSYNWVRLTGVNRVTDANIAGILVNFHDISGRRKAEEEVRVQKHFFEQVFSQSSLSTQILDKEGWCEKINPKLSEIFGVKPVDIQGKVYNIFRDESIRRGGILAHLDKVFSEGKTAEWENHFDIGLSSESQNIKVIDKKKAWFHNWAYPIFDDKGSIKHVIIQHVDITNSKLADEKLRTSETRYRRLFESAKDGILILDADTGLIVDANPFLIELLGYSFDELAGTKLWENPPFKNIADSKRAFIDFQAKEYNRLDDIRLESKSGERISVELVSNVYLVESTKVIQCNIRDITERKRAEEAIQQVNNELKNLHDNLDEAIFSFDFVHKKLLRVSAAHQSIFGFPPSEFYKNPFLWYEMTIPEDKPIVDAGYANLLLGKNHQHQVRIIRRDGQQRWIETRMRPTLDISGNLILIDGITSDITVRKGAENALRNSELRLRTLVQTIPDLIWLKDPDGVYLFCNTMFERFFGMSEAEIVGKTDYDFVSRELADFFRKNDNEVMVLGKSTSNEEWITFADDSHRALLDTTKTPLVDAAGKITGVLGIGHDITKRYEAAQALKESKERFRLLLNNIDEIIYSMKIEDNLMNQAVEFVSNRSEHILGYTPAEFMADSSLWFRIIHPDDLKSVADVTNLSFESKQVRPRIYRMMHKLTRKYVWIEDRPQFLFDKEGKIIGIFGSAHDITQRKTAEEALKKSEIRFRSYFELPIAGIAITGVSTAWIDANDHLCQMLGYSRAELLRTTWTDLTHPDDLQDDRNHYLQILKGEIDGYSIDKRFICKNGASLWTSISVRSVRKENAEVDYFIALVLDISQRKQSEAALKESEERYRSIFDNVSIGIYRTLPTGQILLANPALVQMLGYEHFEELAGRNLEDDGFNPEYQRSEFRRRIEREGNLTDIELAWKRRDQSTIYVRESAKVYRDDEGQVLYYEGIVEDITKRKQNEREIKLLAYSLESINECVSITDKNGLIIFTNESLLQTFGYIREELIGKHISILQPAEIAHVQLKKILQLMGDEGWRGEIMNKKKDGTVFPILLSTSLIRDDKDRPFALVGVARDITEFKRNREELIAAKVKAEENNRLKSAFLNNMSHEIRTPMNAIIGFSDLMLDAGEDERILYAGIVQKSSKQLLMLIDDVIHLSRLQSERLPLNIVEFKPSDIVTDIYQMFNLPDFKKGIDLLINIPQQYKDLTIRSDADKIRQVITNLTSNALRYTLKGSVELGLELNNGDVEFYVKDTGIGIPDTEVHQIFESFYRGKEAISFAIGGTGLGLNIAKMLVELLGGNIGVNSVYEKGSRFYFNVPTIKKDEENLLN